VASSGDTIHRITGPPVQPADVGSADDGYQSSQMARPEDHVEMAASTSDATDGRRQQRPIRART